MFPRLPGSGVRGDGDISVFHWMVEYPQLTWFLLFLIITHYLMTVLDQKRWIGPVQLIQIVAAAVVIPTHDSDIDSFFHIAPIALTLIAVAAYYVQHKLIKESGPPEFF